MASQKVFEITKKYIESICANNDINIHQVNMPETIQRLNEKGLDFVSENIIIRTKKEASK